MFSSSVVLNAEKMKLILVLAFASCAFAFTIRRTLPGRIVGGNLAIPGQFPHQISLRFNGVHNCGGSIIDKNTILTAAHCVDGFPQAGLSVVAGSNTLNQGGSTYSISKVIIHESWNAVSATDDIAVIKLQSSIQFTQNVQPIQIESEVPEAGAKSVLSGWGLTSYPGSTPNNLQYFEGQVIDLDDCFNIFNGVAQYPIRTSNVCTFSRYGQGACKGDSGGPLVANNKQIGLASWVALCAIGYPDVFTSVPFYRLWIQSHMG